NVQLMETKASVPLGRTVLVHFGEYALLVAPRLHDQPTRVEPPPKACPPPPVPVTPAAWQQAVPAPVAVPCCPACPMTWVAPPAPMPSVAPSPPPPMPVLVPRGVQVQMDATILVMDPAFFNRPEGAAWTDLAPKGCSDTPCLLGDTEAQRFCSCVRAHGGKL